MAANVSSNGSLPHPNRSSGVSYDVSCFLSAPSSFIYFSFYGTNIILLLPLCTFVLYLGIQRWRQQRSASSAAVMSHSDAFTYHVAAMELVCVFGSAFFCYGIYSDDAHMVTVGLYLFSFTWYGETFFHVLTCAERYLAVVHPVTYRGLRSQRGIRIRNATICGVWLVSVAETILIIFEEQLTAVMELGVLSFSLVVISFCSLSVLCALIRPGPGHHGGNRDRVDQSKRRAFYTITVILAVLFVRCGWNIAWDILMLSDADCVLTSWPIWFNLLSSLVLPLLFLHKSGRLTCRKSSTVEIRSDVER